jgi:hypothetical protein
MYAAGTAKTKKIDAEVEGQQGERQDREADPEGGGADGDEVRRDASS